MAHNSQEQLQQNQQDYRRSYKACLACRQRKSRCEVDDNWVPGAPCKRCHRQMKQCVFPAERITSKEARQSTAAEDQSQSHEPPSIHQAPASAGVDGRGFQGHDRSPRPSETNVSPYTNSTAHDGSLSDSVMRTMISSGNDALEVLFDPVRQESAAGLGYGAEWQAGMGGNTTTTTQGPRPPASENRTRLRGPSTASSVREVWNACRFIKHGWFTADEAVYLVDMFFTNLQKVSPILTNWYARHENHYELVSSEPLLCCTILCISAGIHTLPTAGGTMRGFFIHERLWTHVQHLILRVLLGQEKNSKGKTRTFGTIQALLLLTEWYPRPLSFPPPIDGWDSDLLVHWTEDNDHVPLEKGNEARGRWLEDVINPAKRTGHMTWMLISCAVSLGVELGVFETDHFPTLPKPTSEPSNVSSEKKTHLQRLLYLYAEQVALQHGRQSMLPQGVSHQVQRDLSISIGNGRQEVFTDAWIHLTRLTKMIMETLYPSAEYTVQLLRNGRYMNMVEHFHPMLASWKEKYIGADLGIGTDFFANFLWIEFHSARLYCHSLCIQAIIERHTSLRRDRNDGGLLSGSGYDTSDYQVLDSVMDDSSQVLVIAVRLAEQQVLRYAPARTTSRIISASIFLLKALGIGAGTARLQSSLDLLQSTITAFRSNAVDEMHLGLRYAALLEMHLSRLQSSFVTSAVPPGSTEADAMLSSGTQGAGLIREDWFSLPFDAFSDFNGMDDIQAFSNFDDGDLDFIWNLDFHPQDK